MSDVISAPCVSCGAPRTRRFCAECGEKGVTHHDYSIVHFGEHVVESLTHFDIRSLRALTVLAFKPGELTGAYLEGRRRAFIAPVQLFVILNVVFALLGGDTFKTPLATQLRDPPFTALKQSMAEKEIRRRGIERQQFAMAFNENAGAQAKTWIFSMIPIYALGLAMAYGFRRYFFEHLVFATHFYTFVLMWSIVAVFVLSRGLRIADVHLTSQTFDDYVTLMILAGLIVYLFVALRRTYGDGVAAAAGRALFLGVLVAPILVGYRFLLFFVTLKTMH